MKRETFITFVAYLFILLFLYTAISKLLAFEITLFDMKRNPLLSDMPMVWAIGVPVAEIIISVLLFLPRTRTFGLYASLILMIGFTGYVGALLASDYQLPCTCGGIFRELSWKQHLCVNIGFTILAFIAILVDGRGRNGRRFNELIAQ